MKLTAIELKNFCALKQVNLEFSPGINVFIGANGTGKTHLMKVLYSTLKANEKAVKGATVNPHDFSTVLGQKLVSVFRPDPVRPAGVQKEELEGLGRLVFRKKGRSNSTVKILLDDKPLSFRITTLGRLSHLESSWEHTSRALFLPTRETVAMFEGFIAAYERSELAFDETYYDLCVAMAANPAKGPTAEVWKSLYAELEQSLGGKVHLMGGRFYVYSDSGLIEAHMLAEGLRKLACLFRLLQNLSLVKNGFLFWDEPEANLNPKLVTIVVRMLLQLASAGVQIFLASHDYLLTNELALTVENPDIYKIKPQPKVRFFCASKQDDGGISFETTDDLSSLNTNPILQEYAAHYDREHSFLHKITVEDKGKKV